MLDPNALSQLSQLKQNIRTEKNLAQGTVRGSQGRFGFLALDDGREAFLAPDVMARVLPGDQVEARVIEKKDNPESQKVEVEFDKLIASTTKILVGQYIVRGKGHFIAVDMPQLSRWIFLPPKARGKAQAGDYLVCRLTKHPFEDGKGQAKVTEILGKADDIGIEHKVISNKHNLPTGWAKNEQTQLEAISQQRLEELADFDQRAKLQDSQFVTIDAATTMDMDDALAITATEQGWKLSVAIADPSSAITAQSPLDKAAQRRANTAYLPGNAITMLPEELSHNVYSLVAGQDRPALVCHMDITTDGAIANASFEFGIVRSAHKLSYDNVAALLEQQNTDAIASDCHPLLNTLAECSHALNAHRREHMLLVDDKGDHELTLNDQQHIASIEPQSRNIAHQIVEEAMLATNRSAGDLFAQHPGSGIFSSHKGFREERMEGIKNVIEADFPTLAQLDIRSREGYRELIQSLHNNPDAAPQLAAMRLMLQAGTLTTQASPHLGLGMQYYATVTSPIRRYNDLHNHRALKAILNGQAQQPPSDDELNAMQQRIGTTRQASRDLEQWLFCLFMDQHKGETHTGRVFRVTSQGITVKLDNWGINGFVKLDPKAFKFDPDRMILKSEAQSFILDQVVEVVIDRIDFDKKRVNFTLAS